MEPEVQPLETPETPIEQPQETPDPTLLSEAVNPPEVKEAKETVLTEPVSFLNPDGTFIDGWKDRLPEEYQKEECLDLIKNSDGKPDFNEMVKQFVNQRKAIGKNKIALPTEKSDENEWNSFYEAIGRPKTHTGYNDPEVPEELKEIFTEDRIARAKERAYALGATQKQFSEYLKGEMEEVVSTITQSEEEIAKAREIAKQDAEKTLRTELGAAYNERMHAANRLITEGIPKETDRLEFIEKYGNDVNIIRLLSNVGARMSEHTALIGELTQKTPTDIKQRIDKILGNPDYRNINSVMPEAERQQLTDELNQLYKQLYPVKAG